MSFREVASCLFIVFVALANGMPQTDEVAPKESAGPLPFIQFTNGGIRLNFAGYHAEAGLGGLLRGVGSGGGLHASVGTPWGAHAGAGLGGRLGADDGQIGGGMYARAGLGNGRPEAAAGLGGMLDGSGRSLNPISGGLYAGASPGGGLGTGVEIGGGYAREDIDAIADFGTNDEVGAIPRAAIGLRMTTTERSADNSDDDDGGKERASTSTTEAPRGRTNIQIIPSRKKKPQQDKERAALQVAALPADAPVEARAESRVNEVRRAVKYTVVVPAAEAAPVVKSVKVVAVAPQPPVPVHGEVQANPVNVTTDDSSNPPPPPTRPATYPRWYFRKRFRNVPRKVVQVAPAAAAAESRSSPSDATGPGGLYEVDKTSGSLFDDIFNIPISALTAVNQLLKNNVG